MFRCYWKERTVGDQGRRALWQRQGCDTLGFVLEAHGCLWFHKPRLPLMPQLDAVIAPGLGPGGFCELLMTQGAEDSARPEPQPVLLFSTVPGPPRWSLWQDRSKVTVYGNESDVPPFEVRWWEQQPPEWRQWQKAHNEHRRREWGQVEEDQSLKECVSLAFSSILAKEKAEFLALSEQWWAKQRNAHAVSAVYLFLAKQSFKTGISKHFKLSKCHLTKRISCASTLAVPSSTLSCIL